MSPERAVSVRLRGGVNVYRDSCLTSPGFSVAFRGRPKGGAVGQEFPYGVPPGRRSPLTRGDGEEGGTAMPRRRHKRPEQSSPNTGSQRWQILQAAAAVGRFVIEGVRALADAELMAKLGHVIRGLLDGGGPGA